MVILLSYNKKEERVWKQRSLRSNLLEKVKEAQSSMKFKRNINSIRIWGQEFVM
jgi:hypothetical protein